MVNYIVQREAILSDVIGFIGLGLMGKPMAKNLIKHGYSLVVHNRSRGPVDDLVGAGARAAASPADLAGDAAIIITMVPDTPDVEQVLTGVNGILSALRPGTVVIDMSSISPVATRRLSAAVATQGGAMLDAPVSGGEIGAIDGTLSIMVGGEAAIFDQVRPILNCMGNPERIVYIGGSGAGQICKICNQIAIGGALAGVSEAFALAKKSGVDASRVRSALLGGFAASRVLEVHGDRILKGSYDPGFRAKLYHKDLRLANETAGVNGVSMPVTAVVTQFVNALLAAGDGELDCAAVGKVWLDLAKVR